MSATRITAALQPCRTCNTAFVPSDWQARADAAHHCSAECHWHGADVACVPGELPNIVHGIGDTGNA